MADYWKSQPRKLCDFCKCWIADNKPSRDFHERGKRHQENVAKRISELRKKGLEQAKHEKDEANWMVQMEREAMKKLREDLTADPSLAAQYGVKFKSQVEEEKQKTKFNSKSTDAADDWQEVLSPEGYVYYWNKKTGVSAWELPTAESTASRGDVQQQQSGTSEPSLPSSVAADQQKTSQKCLEDQNCLRTAKENDKEVHKEKQCSDIIKSEQSTSLWQKLLSPEGHPYYWNTQTGEVSWELPPSEENSDIKLESTEEPGSCDAVSSVKSESTETVTTPSASLADGNSNASVVDAEPSRKRPAHSVYGEWQELKDESEPVIDLELPVDQNKDEVKTIVVSEEPKFRFKEKTFESLGARGTGSKTVEFKKRKLNSGAAKGNIRRSDDDQNT